MRYLPLSEADRRDMLSAIGAPSVEALFRDVPESARRATFALPDHAGEIEVGRTLAALAAKSDAIAKERICGAIDVVADDHGNLPPVTRVRAAHYLGAVLEGFGWLDRVEAE